jgi:AraC-like DNA-binding protein
MLSEDLDATHVALREGYRDASQFNREYKSLFGVPPMRDVQQLRVQDQLNDLAHVAICVSRRFDTDQTGGAK